MENLITAIFVYLFAEEIRKNKEKKGYLNDSTDVYTAQAFERKLVVKLNLHYIYIPLYTTNSFSSSVQIPSFFSTHL